MFRQIVNWFNNLPVRYKLIGGFGLVALVPLLSLGLYTILTTTQTLEENEIETLTQVDALRAAEVEGFLLEREEELVAVSDFSSIDLLAASLTQQQGEEAYNLAVDAVAHDFLALANNLPFFDQIRYLSTDGVELVRVDRDPGQPAVTAPTAQLQDQADNAYFQEAASLPEGSVYISPVNLNREQGQIEEPFTPVLRMSTPVYDDLNGQFAGVLVFNVRADAFFTFLEAFENEQVYLVDSAGTFLLHPEEGARWAADLGHGTVLETQFPERAAEFLSTESGSLLTDSDLIVYETITVGAADNLELRLITTEPLDVVLAPVRQFRNASLAVAAVALAAAVGAGLLISGLITRQVDALDDLFRKVGMGDFAARAEVYSRDELGVAADGINRMLERLVDLLNQTNAERARLEASVTRLVNEVAGLASGDLSITVNAEDETTGAIAQALNFAINELNQIVYGVERAATDMTTASQSMGSAISTMVQQATSSADLADLAAESASVGDQAVSLTVAAMAGIRVYRQESARRIKR
ncbi:MAG: methyl-accepting chemotaxis protein, partial [Chloroflexi bacterium]|nr:methyl-accepting chemotaxis protein [Chloroflexota bacterium]